MDMYQKRKARKEKSVNEHEKSCASMNINWYPGHMAKTRKQILEDLKLVDVVIEILDARIPISAMHGSSATAQQSQSTLMFFITFMNAIFPLKYLTTELAASAIDSKNLS